MAEERCRRRKLPRRDLLKTIPLCALLIAAKPGEPQDKKLKPSVSIQGDTKLCTYCGIYCGACDVYNNNVADSARTLMRILDSYGYTFSGVPEIGESYPDFKKVLAYIAERFEPGVTCKCGCENGLPDCPIRACAQSRGIETCAFCVDFPCNKLRVLEEPYGIIAELTKQKELGLQAWANKMQIRVDAGWTYTDLIEPKADK